MTEDMVTIKDFETDDEIAEIDADGELRTSDEEFKKVMLDLTDGEGAVPRRTADYDEEQEAHITRITRVSPGEDGYLHTIADVLPSPFKVAGTPDLSRPDLSDVGNDGDASETDENTEDVEDEESSNEG